MTFSDNTRQLACFGAAGFIGTALVLAVAYPAHAGQPISQKPVTVIAKKDTMTERVPYGDLVLTSREGRRLLYHRVDAAVRTVCPDQDEEGYTYDQQGCKDFAWAGARPQIRRAIDRAQLGPSFGMAILISTAPTK